MYWDQCITGEKKFEFSLSQLNIGFPLDHVLAELLQQTTLQYTDVQDCHMCSLMVIDLSNCSVELFP